MEPLAARQLEHFDVPGIRDPRRLLEKHWQARLERLAGQPKILVHLSLDEHPVEASLKELLRALEESVGG